MSKITIEGNAVLKEGEQIATYDAATNTVLSEKRLAPQFMGEITAILGEKPKYDFGEPNAEEEKPQNAPTKAGVPTVGRIVRYVGTTRQGVVERPAIIVDVREDGDRTLVNLQVFMNGNGGSYGDGTLPTVWQQDVQQSEGPELGKFYFPQIK